MTSRDNAILAALKGGELAVDEEGRISVYHRRRRAFMPSTSRVKRGYVYVNVPTPGSGEWVSVFAHRVVAIALIGPPPFQGAEVNHRNGCKGDNRPGNLEWVDHQGQMRHASAAGLLRPQRGVDSGVAKLNERKVREIVRLVRTGHWTKVELARHFRVTPQAVGAILKGATWAHVTGGAVAAKTPGNAGERSGGAKLKRGQVSAIRRALQSGRVTINALAARYQVGRATIRLIKTGRTWAGGRAA